MIIDTHCHLDLEEFDKDREEVIERALKIGSEKIITVGVDILSSQKAVELSQKYRSVFAAVGIQPEEIDKYIEETPCNHESIPDYKLNIDVNKKLTALAKSKRVVAIGEIGLDYRWLKKGSASAALEKDSPLEVQKEKQKDIFRRQLGLAVLMDLPVIVHNREADEDTLREIRRYKETKRLRGVIHCFTGSLEFAKKIIDAGFLLSFTGIITYPNAQELQKVVKEIPLDKIMVETDAPFLAPQAYRGRRNEPSFILEVTKKVAEIKNLNFEEICFNTSENAQRLFRI